LDAPLGGGGTPTAFLTVGGAFGSGGTSGQGSSATGALAVTGGNIGAFQGVAVGQSFGSAAHSTGVLELTNGTLSSPTFLTVGYAGNFGGAPSSADGTLRVTNGAVQTTSTPSSPGFVGIGVAFDGGTAVGRVIATDSLVALSSVTLGSNFAGAGSAEGRIDLLRSSLTATEVFAGFGPGASATLALVDSSMAVEHGFTLTNGVLSLERSLLGVGDTFTLGDGAAVHIDIDGLLRGLEYGAIDAAAALDGLLQIDLAGLVPFGDVMIFDLIRSGSATGIDGDFDALSFLGVPLGYSPVAGIELDGVEIYRLRLTRDVPEPGTGLLVLVAAGVLFALRRRARSR
jgi:hypothetical protein